MARLSDRGFTSTRGLSYTLEDTATTVDAALPASHGLGAVPSSLELWVEVSAGEWEQHDASTYVTASSTALTSTGTTLASVVGGGTNVRLVAAAGAVALSVAEASASQAGIVSTGTQTFGGAKTFNGAVTLSGGVSGDFVVNTNQIFVEQSTGKVAFSTADVTKGRYTFAIGANDKFVLSDFNNVQSGNLTAHIGRGTSLVWRADQNPRYASNENGEVALIKAEYDSSVSDGLSGSHALTFHTFSGWHLAGSLTERMRIDSSGRLLVGTTASPQGVHVAISTTDSRVLDFRTQDSATNAPYIKRYGFAFSRGVAETTVNLLDVESNTGNAHTAIEIKMYYIGAIGDQSGIITAYAYARRASTDTDYTYGTNSPTIERIQGTTTGAGSLSWSGNTLRYTTDANQNYTAYKTEITVWSHDRGDITFY